MKSRMKAGIWRAAARISIWRKAAYLCESGGSNGETQCLSWPANELNRSNGGNGENIQYGGCQPMKA